MEPAFVGRLVAACAVIAAMLYGFSFAARALKGSGVRPGSLRPRFSRLGRFGPGAPEKFTTIVETTPLPEGASLHVVRVAGRHLLLGRSASSISMLYEIPGDAAASLAVET